MCSAPLQINDLDPTNLPEMAISLDMFILKNQDIVITSNWVIDQTITMDFPNCIQAINQRFSQLLVLVKQPFNQALVLINQKMEMGRFHASIKHHICVKCPLLNVGDLIPDPKPRQVTQT